MVGRKSPAHILGNGVVNPELRSKTLSEGPDRGATRARTTDKGSPSGSRYSLALRATDRGQAEVDAKEKVTGSNPVNGSRKALQWEFCGVFYGTIWKSKR